ncbi:MAG: transcription elongation factor GreA [Candidatus Omnitrophica bacterium]|nr:transcription elongation factor GreA [Candidatus Omnitrophota bacterium]
MSSGAYLTHEGYEELRKKLEYLKTKKRRELSKAIKKARGHGDISENAEYDAAKEAQGLNEKRVAELEQRLSNAQMLDDTQIPKDEALLGATVLLKDLASGEEFQYMLVSELEADLAQGKVSVTSPVGKSLLGHKKNETVEINAPVGVLKYKILKISRTS